MSRASRSSVLHPWSPSGVGSAQSAHPHASHSQHCPHRPPCPGCPRFGEPGLAPQGERALNELAARHGLTQVPVISAENGGFRTRARLAIRGRLGSPKLGLFELGTHRVVHIPNCVVHHPLINQVSQVVRRALVDARITCYSDGAHEGLARYLQVVIERSSGSAQLVLVGNSESAQPFLACLESIRDRLGSALHSLWWNGNRSRSNTILGDDWQQIYGPPSVVEHFGAGAVHYPPGAFGQSNLGIAERIIGHVRELLAGCASEREKPAVCEFYAGVGAIGLSVLGHVRELRLNEVSPQSLFGLSLGLGELTQAERAPISLHPGTAAEARQAALGVNVVIADPPRKGLDPELTQFLKQHPPELLIYVSCGLESFLRDAAELCGAGKLVLRKLTAFNLLPFTEHVETVACFERA